VWLTIVHTKNKKNTWKKHGKHDASLAFYIVIHPRAAAFTSPVCRAILNGVHRLDREEVQDAIDLSCVRADVAGRHSRSPGGCGPGTLALIDATPLVGVVPLTVAFDGTGSTSADGISTYSWSFGTDDPDVHVETGTHTYEHAGTYALKLTVRGSDGSTATTSVTVTVDPAMWITDANLNTVYKLDMQGTQN